ncbi:class I SAM-dependent methyltransferase [Streptomyces durbertensis]|uniref:Class I SAM-dependent methyltransferase n=1 Tax=Streptomyces durbertensis TaxID=2448886 RepID=A0ABR6EHY1_9ACTN|nr:class I SAM-dependent methyltransferase [Streptomyces durbertensis]MBB1244124.1 class I SAM-dependent methyltransferase [Streptomyces durbertensis]
MYGAQSARIYEAQHRERGKDYVAEAKDVVREIHARMPAARSVLDVACGTGGHAGPFTEVFDEVQGLELSEPMLELAREALPGVPLHQGDMRDFDLGRVFDAVTCLFASIGYVGSEDELRAAIRTFARHTAPGGVVAVEPWWFPETFLDKHVSGDVVRVDGVTVARVSHTVRDGDASRMEVRYLTADPEKGISSFSETHRAMLFTRESYEAAFRDAGLTVDYVPGVQCGRGLFVGVRR